ncbi:pejvakin-like [Watersipora subatra]|uniref:pejvakin-like n=1 Tax=Watersipora subatra TaxID=2589382 RepID=UPI00355BC5B8
MFKIAVNNLVQSIGGDVYLPSPSTAASKNLAPLSLVERKNSVLPLKQSHYYTTDFILQDIVTGKHVEVEAQKAEKFCTFNRESRVKVEGMLQGHIKGIFDAGVRLVDSVAIKTELGELIIEEVDIQSLLNDLNDRELKMCHELVREISAGKRKALCVVTGVVKTTSSASISAKLGTEAAGHLEISQTSSFLSKGRIVSGRLKGSHETDSTRELNLPAGTVLAYQLSELAVNKQGKVQIMVAHGSKGGFHLAF